MKYILLIILFSIFCRLYSQSYLPLPLNDTSSIWSVTEVKFFAAGDTSIDGKEYTKILYHKRIPVANIDSASYLFAINSDTSNGKVWARLPGYNSDKLLYDFGMNVGDQAYVHHPTDIYGFTYNQFDSTLVRVISVGLDTIAGAERKVVEVEYYFASAPPGWEWTPWGGRWIEGIGSTSGLLYPWAREEVFGNIFPPILFCFEEGGQQTYSIPFHSSCYYSMGVVEHEASKVSVYPNPTNDILYIRIDKFEGGSLRLDILDVTGKLCITKIITSAETALDVKQLKGGLYNYRIVGSSGASSGKFVVK